VSSLKSPDELTIETGAGAVTALAYRSDEPRRSAWLVLAHGAGAGQRSPFMIATARGLASRGISTITFNFPYTEHGRRIPDRTPVLDACYVRVISAVREQLAAESQPLFIGGKSMGGRISTHVAAANADLPISGLVLLGYPLHPPGRPDNRRDAHLPAIHTPMLIVQGERDTFGTPGELDEVLGRMSPRPTLHVVPQGDHSFKVSRAGKAGQQAIDERVLETISGWIGERVQGSSRCSSMR
jgi:predicted alpha/beta-hydrolase family hydrolase